MKRKTKAPVRVHDECEIAALPSAWHQVCGLMDDKWYAVYQARNNEEAHKFLSLAIDEESPAMDKWEDYFILVPELEHQIPTHIKGQHRTWLESVSPATRNARRLRAAAAAPQKPRARGRVAQTAS